MFFQRVCLDNYIPFSHGGVKHVEFEPHEPCVAILGGNGSGKSSLLSQLSVLPQARTLYSKNGSISLTVEHNGDLYDISSDFSKASAPYSFKKNGEELNIGGTSETQKDLVEENFGLVPYINSIVSGKAQLCNTIKSARKTLLSECYPSDLTFVLEYHKKVCSQIRAFGNQIKLLQTREGSLSSALLSPAENKRMSDIRDTYLGVIDRIDKVNLLLENEIIELRRHPAMQHEYHPEDLQNIEFEIEKIHRRYVAEFLDINETRHLGETIDSEHLGINYATLNTELLHLEKNKETISENLQTIRDELNKFANLKYSSTDDKRTALVNELNVIKNEAAALEEEKAWNDMVIIPMNKVLDVIECESDIDDMVSNLHQYTGSLLDQETLDRTRNDIYIAQSTIKSLTAEKTELETQIAKSEARLEQLTKNSYPQDCQRVCPLRSTVEGAIRDVRLRIESYKGRIADINKHMTGASVLIETNTKLLNEINPAYPVIRRLKSTLEDNCLIDIALRGEKLIDCLNSHGQDISNRIRIGLAASKKYHRCQNLKNRIEQITHTLGMMDSLENTQMSTDVINGIIADKEKKLEAGISKLEEIDARCAKLVAGMDHIANINGILRELQTIITRTETAMNIKLVRTRIEFDKEIIAEHTRIKNDLSTKLREIERTLTEQKRISDILHSETLPQLENIRKEKQKWEAVEQALSPTKGLPCIYLVRFINRLFARMNAYIKEVWSYDMELVYLNEEDDLDFTFQVMINKSSIVQDISVCSNGQKAIIDLAFILAVCVERGWNNKFAICMDEVDSALTDEHRGKLVGLISELLDNGTIKQLFLVNHFAIQTGIQHCETVALSTDGVVLPAEYNLHANIF